MRAVRVRRLAVGAFFVAVLVGGVARAAVTLSPFAAPEDLALFAPEIGRVVGSVLDRAGIDVVPSGGVSVSGRIEALGGERVRLRAQVAAHPVEVDGDIEHLDMLAADLGARIASSLPASARRPPGVASRSVNVLPHQSMPRPVERVTVLSATPSPSIAASPSTTARTNPSSSSESMPPAVIAMNDRPATPPASDPAPAAAPPSPTVAAPSPSDAPPRAVPPSEPPAPVLAVAPPATPPTPTPPAVVEDKPPIVEPLRPHPVPPPPDAKPIPVEPWTPPAGRRERWARAPVGRVMMYHVGAPEGCQVGAWASMGVRDVLDRRFHVQTLLSPRCGYAPLAVAATEAARAGVGTSLMMWFDSLSLEPGPNATWRAHGVLRVMVVQGGQEVLHRQLSLPTRTLTVPDMGRAAYDLSLDGLNAVGNELMNLLGGAR